MRVSSAALRRAATLVGVALVLAATCAFLGRWQWDKHVARDAANATIGANWSAPAVPLASLVPSAGDAPTPAAEWRSVAVTGHYLTSATVLLRNRPVAGAPAYHVLVPFQVDGGAVLVVDRGAVALGDSGTTSAAVAPPPAGTVDLVARLRVPEPASTKPAPAAQVQTIDPAQVLAAGGLPASTVVYRWYVAASSESPAPATALGRLDSPSTAPGPYLSYAVQWWIFAVAGLAAFGWMARREIVDDLAGRARPATPAAPRSTAPELEPVAAAVPSAPSLSSHPTAPTHETVPVHETPPLHATTPRPATVARRRRGRDELAEDALIDAQHRDGTR